MSATINHSGELEVDLPAPQVVEHPAFGTSGWPMLGLSVAGVLGSIALMIWAGVAAQWWALVLGGAVFVMAIVLAGGLTVVNPGEARVLQVLGRYSGTVRVNGLRWVNPITSRRKVSTRIRNHETGLAKVNDADGSPIEIAAVVVWQVEDTAKAVFEVDDFVEFVAIQTETAVRHIANSYPYDSHDDRPALAPGQRRGDHRQAVG